MADQRKRLEKSLRGCADAGVPDTTDLWPVVKERVFAGRVGTEQAGQGGATRYLAGAHGPRNSCRTPRSVGRSRPSPC